MPYGRRKKDPLSHSVDAYKFDQSCTTIHLHEKLTEDHFNLDPSLRMCNHLAEDVLGRRMLFLMKVIMR